MAYPGEGLSNQGYLSDGSNHHYPNNEPVNPNQIKFGYKQYGRQRSESINHDYEELPNSRGKHPPVRLQSFNAYSMDNEADYAETDDYSVAPTVPSIASMPSTNSLDWQAKDSRAASSISIISDKPRKRQNPLYDTTDEKPVHYTKPVVREESKMPMMPSNLNLLWILLIVFMVLTVILLIIVIVLIAMVSGNVSKDELKSYNSSVQALQNKVSDIDTVVSDLTSPNIGDLKDPAFLMKLHANLTESMSQVHDLQTSLAGHTSAASSNFTKLDTRVDGFSPMVSDIRAVNGTVQDVNKRLHDHLNGAFSNFCRFETKKQGQTLPMNQAMNSGEIAETDKLIAMATKCSTGGVRQEASVRFALVTGNPGLSRFWCVCLAGSDSTVVYRECRLHVIMCRTDLG